MDSPFPCDATVSIPGPVGALEALTACPSATAAGASAVVCHPHPLHGGTMQNKVVHTLARTFVELGLHTVRFNFRGTGASEGEFAQGMGETEDALAVLDWVRAHRPNDALWLAGFSFGAAVALRAAHRAPVAQLVTVAPAINLYADLAALPAPRIPWLLVQGELDEVVPPATVKAWAERLDPKPEQVWLPATGHFFHQRLTDLRDRLTERLAPRLPRR